MNDTLFDVPPQLSPRLAWMQKHEVKTHHVPESDDPPWWCWCGPDSNPTALLLGAMPHEYFVQADTEDEAIVAHAIKRGIKLWNEE